MLHDIFGKFFGACFDTRIFQRCVILTFDEKMKEGQMQDSILEQQLNSCSGDDTLADWRDTLRYLGHLLLKQDKRAAITLSSLNQSVSRATLMQADGNGF